METQRLLLREFREEDYRDIVHQIYEDKDVWGMYSGIGNDTKEIRRRFLHRLHQPTNAEFGFRVIELKSTNHVIGQIHLEPHVLDPHSIPEKTTTPFDFVEVELAFAIGKTLWGQGLAYEACNRMIEYAFKELKLPRLVGGASRKNDRSLRLHKRLGFEIKTDPTDSDFMSAVLANNF